jgi:2-methylisocitrate lyase-like PEP mutase family enzyme
MTRTIDEKRALFRSLHQQGCFAIPNPWDTGSARYLQGLGFKALATTSSGFAWSQGQPDGETSLEETIAHFRALVAATDLPVSADFGNGFATDVRGVEENVRLAIETGVAGLSIEDASGNNSDPIFDIETATARIRAARSAIDQMNANVILIGRADNFFHGLTDIDDTVKRLKAYSEAGADCLYAPGINTRDQILAVVAAVSPKPINLLIGARNEFTLPEIAELGVRRVSVGGALARAAWSGFMHAAQSIAQLGQFESLTNIASSDQLNAFFRISGDAPLMKQPASIIGKVEYREGEGPSLTIPLGSVEVETTSMDAVISWADGKSHGLAAMPVANFCQYIADGSITVSVKPPMQN